MTQDQFIARECIRQTITNYTIAGDSRNAELFSAQWTEDATFEFADFPPLPSFRLVGLDAIRTRTTLWAKLPVDDPTLRSVSFVRHNITTCHIELTGKDTAAAKTYFIVMTDIGPDHAGNYSDSLVRRGERWLFAHRRIDLLWRSPNSCYPPVKR
jgi:hypothetical protein